MCGCSKCFRNGYFDPKKMPEHLGQCYKEDACEAALVARAWKSLEDGLENPPKPQKKPSKAPGIPWQVVGAELLAAEKADPVGFWARIKASEQAIKDKKAKAINDYADAKFSVRDMEYWYDRRALYEGDSYKTGPAYTAFLHYAKEQKEKADNYNKDKENIMSDADYHKAETSYKVLLKHINDHGQLIKEVPERKHKKPTEQKFVAPKMGRRASRKAKRELAASTETGRVYSRAELRALARGDGEGSTDSVESDKDE